MTQEHGEKNMPAHSTGTAEEEQKKIVDAKEAIHKGQEQIVEDGSAKGMPADRATGVNAEHEEPIDPRMTKMPPA